MPDLQGNPTPAEISAALQGFTTGPLGDSPATRAAIEAFKIQSLPVIQQQFQLQGLGRSPALGQAVGQSLGVALPQFINADLVNRLQAAQQLQQQLFQGGQLGLAGAQRGGSRAAPGPQIREPGLR